MTRGAGSLSLLGEGFDRPESVHFQDSGAVAASHRGVGVRILQPDGTAMLLGRSRPTLRQWQEFLPNGIVAESDTSYLIANIGPAGGLWRATPGRLDRVELSRPVPPLNYVTKDSQGRLWATASTTLVPRSLAYHREAGDGLLLLLGSVPDPADRHGIVDVDVIASDLHYPNEIAFSPDETEIYVNETMAFRTSVFGLAGKHLGRRRTLATFAEGDFCDGVTTDAQGLLWVTCIVSNRLYMIEPGREPELFLDDGDRAHTARACDAYRRSQMGRTWFDSWPPGARVGHISSLAISPDGRVGVLGCLLGSELFSIALR